MRHPSGEKRVRRGRRLIHMGVKIIPRERREMLDIFQRDHPRFAGETLAHRQLAKRQPERMRPRGLRRRPLDPVSGDRTHHPRRPLQGGPLHIMQHTPGAPHLLAPAGPPRPAMHQHRQRRSMAGGVPPALPVGDQHAPMKRRRPVNHLNRHRRIMREERHHERPRPQIAKGHRIRHIRIRHDGRHRPERLPLMHQPCPPRVIAAQQNRRDERAPLIRPRRRRERVAKHDRRLHREGRHGFPHIRQLRPADQRAHGDPFLRRVADHHLAQRRAQRVLHGIQPGRRRENPPDRGAFLPRFHGHLPHDLRDEQVKFRAARSRIRPQHGRVQTIPLRQKPHALARHHRMRLQFLRRRRRAGEGDHILPPQMLKQIPRRARDKLQRPLRQQPGLQQNPHALRRHVSRRGGRLHNRRHPRQQSGPELLQHAPYREIERIDMHRHPLPRGIDMLPDKPAFFGEVFHPPINDDPPIGQLPPALGGVREQRRRPALDIHPPVPPGRPRESGERIKFLLARQHRIPQPAQNFRALMECQPRQRRFRVCDGPADPGFHFRLDVGGDHIDAEMQRTGGPASPDHTGPEQSERLDGSHGTDPQVV